MRHNLLFCDERVKYNITELITIFKRDDFSFLPKNFSKQTKKQLKILYVLDDSYCFLKKNKYGGQLCTFFIYVVIQTILGSIKNFKIRMNEEIIDDQELEVFAENYASSEEDIYFDQVVMCLQDVMLQEAFQTRQQTFMREHCKIFENKEQNKNEYMVIFTLYQQSIEQYVQHQLHLKIKNFSMQRFLGLLTSRHSQIDEQLLDLVESFTDFLAFKSLMLDYKNYLENENQYKELSVRSNRIG